MEKLYCSARTIENARYFEELAESAAKLGATITTPKQNYFQNVTVCVSHAPELNQLIDRSRIYEKLLNDSSIYEKLEKGQELKKRHEEENEKTIARIEELKNSPDEIALITKNIRLYWSDGITVTFNLDGINYYLSLGDFGALHYSKRPIENGNQIKKCYMDQLNEWYRYSPAELLEKLISANNSEPYRESYKTRVPNYYNGGYHYERIYKPQQYETIKL